MTTPAPELRPFAPPAARGDGVGWDALVAVVAGVGLLVVGLLDVRAYLAGINRPLVAFQLANLKGDTRVGEDEFFHAGGSEVRLANVGAMESTGSVTFRHAFGPVQTVEIWSERTNAQLDFAFVGISPDEVVSVAFNGQTLEEIHGANGLLQRRYPLALHPGANDFTLSFSEYNHHGIEFEAKDPRPIAGTYQALNVSFP